MYKRLLIQQSFLPFKVFHTGGSDAIVELPHGLNDLGLSLLLADDLKLGQEVTEHGNKDVFWLAGCSKQYVPFLVYFHLIFRSLPYKLSSKKTMTKIQSLQRNALTIRAPVFVRNQNSAPQSITESPWNFAIWTNDV